MCGIFKAQMKEIKCNFLPIVHEIGNCPPTMLFFNIKKKNKDRVKNF